MGRARLDRARVIATAARIADKEGLDSLTLARLAHDLRIKSPSLYNHVEGVTEVLDELNVLAVTQLLERSREAIMGRSGRDALEALAQTQRAYAREHPGLYSATFRRLHGRGFKQEKIANAYVEVFLAVLREYGIKGKPALHMVRSLRAAIGGFIELELRGGFGMPLDVDASFRFLLDLLVEGMSASTHETTQARRS